MCSYWLLTKASVGSSRSQIATSPRPSGNSMGTSFMECTARSARPSSMASSSSFTNRPLPPIFASGTSRILSPWVLILTSSTVMLSCSRSSSDLMNSACHSARALLRVAMRRVRLDMALTVVRGKCAPRLPCGRKKSRHRGVCTPHMPGICPLSTPSGGGLVFLQPLANGAGMFATDGQCRLVTFEEQAVMTVGVAPQAADKAHPHQGVAMNPQQLFGVGLFQFFQGVVAQGFTPGMVQGYVLVVGFAVENGVQVNQLGTPVGANCQLPGAVISLPGEAAPLYPVCPASPLQGLRQGLFAHRLEQVAAGLHVKGLDGVMVIGRAENHRRRIFQLADLLRRLHAVHAGHANIQQQDIGLQAGDLPEGIVTVSGFTAHLVSRQVFQQPVDTLSRQWFVIGNQDALLWVGIHNLTVKQGVGAGLRFVAAASG